MVSIKQKTGWFVCFILLFVILDGCKKRNSEPDMNNEKREVAHADMQYFDFDRVDDLSIFLDSIRIKHGLPIRNLIWEDYAEKEICSCIERLEGYRNGKYKYYPDSLVRESINTLGYECAFIINHECELDKAYAEWFLMMAAYYSPDISCLVHMQTPNHRAGVQNFGSQYNDNPWWSYIFLKRNKGFEVRRISGDYTRIERIYQLQDEKKRLYYLCSNNTSFAEFRQVLFWGKNEEKIICVAQCDSLPVKNTDFDQCYFNIEKRAWYCCNKDRKTNKLIPLTEEPALVLKLNGDNSYFKAIDNQ